jgi:hypothetical protein
MRNLYALLLVACLTGCTRSGPDMSPVGGGLAVVGLSLIVSTLLIRIRQKGGSEDE